MRFLLRDALQLKRLIAPAPEPPGQRQPITMGRQDFMGHVARQEQHQRAARGLDVQLAAILEEQSQLPTVLRLPGGIVQVDHRRDHALVIIPETVDVSAIERTRRV